MGLLAPARVDASDPNLALWYKLDESGSTKSVPDSSGYGHTGTIVTWPDELPVNWDPGDGHDGGCLVFFDDTRINVPISTLDGVIGGISISLWVKDAWRLGQNWAFDAATDWEAAFRITACIGTAPDAEVMWQAGNDSNDAVRWDGGNVQDLKGWHLWTLVKDEAADNIRIYFDGLPAASKSAVADTLRDELPAELDKPGFVFKIGASSSHENHLKARVDDFRLYDRALSDAEVERLYYTGGDETIAWKPNPVDGTENLCDDVVLSWSPGDLAAQHDVYFGTDATAVEDATTSSPEYRPPRLNLGNESYDAGANETLSPGTTYYWRIDEVDNPTVWKGDVWEFTINDGNAFDPDPADGETAVLNEAILSWSPGCWAASHDVYFGTDQEEVEDATTASVTVYKGSQALGETSYDPCDFDYLTDYYWRIDEVNGLTKWKGQVWTFTSQTRIIDPNNTLWYKLDEMEGYVAYDSSNFQNDGTIDIPSREPVEWDADGQWGSSLHFFDGTGLWVPTPVLSRITSGVGIIFWTNGQSSSVLHADGGDSELLVNFETGQVTWRAGNGTTDVLAWDYDGKGKPTGWHCWGFVKDEVAGNMVIYFDGEPAAANSVGTSNLADVRNKPFKIGAETWQDGDFSGNLDDFIVYDRALSGNEILRQYYVGGPVGKVELAWNPDPYDGAVDVYRDANLAWSPGDYAVEHDVYFGTDYDDVNDATTSSAGIYKGRQDPCEYDPPGVLVLDTRYYWRIDEVNDPCLWKGKTWRFTAANFLVIDDFESYDDTNRIYYTWEDQGTNWTGATISLGTTPFDPVYTRSQSMGYLYDNKTKWDFFSYWSLVERPFTSPQDWTEVDVKALTMYLYGDPGNDIADTEQLYVGVTDNLARYAEVPYPDMNDLQLEEWTEWNVQISGFTSPQDVDETQVTRLSLVFGSSSNTTIAGGDGLVYFDDIRLYPTRCVPSIIKPYADLNNNCIVEWGDVAIIGDQWLRTDLDFRPPVPPPSGNLVGHWALDGNANDSTSNNNHGTPEGIYAWVAGRIGPNSIEFSGAGGRVLVPDAPELRPQYQFTVSAWMNAGEQTGSPRILVKGADDSETYAIQLVGVTPNVIVRDVNGEGPFGAASDIDVEDGEWAHVAASYDGTDAKIYVDGQLGGSEEHPGMSLSQDPNGLAIGNRSDAMDRAFIGRIDDVQLYDIALSHSDIVYLASEGVGYIPLDTSANLYDPEPVGQKVINIRDLAVVMAAWLDETMWP
jgi:hypothetical protein